MPNENNSLRNSLAQYLLGRDFFAFGTAFAVGMCCKSLRHKDLRQTRRAVFSISPYAVRAYVTTIRGWTFVHYPNGGYTRGLYPCCLAGQVSRDTPESRSCRLPNLCRPPSLLRQPNDPSYPILPS